MTLRELRESRGLSQQEIADLLCVTAEVYDSYERNPDLLTIPEWVLLSRSLNCDIDALFHIES